VKSYELTRLQMGVVNRQLSATASSSQPPAGTPSSLSCPVSVQVSEPTLNPFRSPVRKQDLQTAVPAFSNAVVFHLEYTQQRL